MLRRKFTEPWFAVYILVFSLTLLMSVYLGIPALMLSLIIILSVEYGLWPRSVIWTNKSFYFKYLNRILIGGFLLVFYFSGQNENLEKAGFALIYFSPFLLFIEVFLLKELRKK